MLYCGRMPYSEEMQEQLIHAQDIFVWEAPSFEAVERGPKWHWWVLGLSFVATIYGILTTNYLFAFIVLMIGIILILNERQGPKKILIQIGNHGLVYDGNYYAFDSIADFAIIYQPPTKKILYIQPSNVLYPRLRIDLGDEDPVNVRNHLRRFVDEDLDLREEHISDIFGRLLKI